MATIQMDIKLAEGLAKMTSEERSMFLNEMTDDEIRLLEYSWYVWARPAQRLPEVQFRIWLIQAGRGYGKMSDINDLIRTEDGWKKLGDIVDGDKVFGADGKMCNVVKAHPIQYAKKTYKLTFDTHETVICGEEHLWYTETRNERRQILRGQSKEGKVRTTQEIVDTLKHFKETNHAIPVNKPLQLPEQNLPIHPYVLGCWLGDGSKSSSAITNVDTEVWSQIVKCGYEIKPSNTITHSISNGAETQRNDLGQYQSNGSMISLLKEIGIYKDKRIPRIYMNASYEQRLEILQGLMDTDGYCNENGWCEIAQVKTDLLDDIFELVGSLGIKAHRHTGGKRMLNGEYYGEKDYVFFKTFVPVFKMQRKLDRQMGATKAQYRRQLYRFIVKAEEVESTPLRCLTVDSEDHLFLVGKSFIPTHNTKTGAETIRLWKDMGYKRFALVGITPADIRDVMIEGTSGLLQVCPPWDKPEYQASKRRVVWADGSVATMYSGANPEQLRGPQHEKAWCDEIFAWQYPQETWDMLMFGLRLGNNPQVVVTSTPKPLALLKWMRQQATCTVTQGSTYENQANLAESFFSEICSKYEGTRLGMQELEAKILDDNPNALWSRKLLDDNRVVKMPNMKRIVVAVDPAISANENSDETGIIVAGLGSDNHGYVFADKSLKGKPNDWGNAAITQYNIWKADRIVAEINQGGDMVESTIMTIDPKVAYRGVHASKGKYTRAEPVSALYEQGKVHHVGTFGNLEDQMCEWEQGMDSPDRLDACVFAITELMLVNRPTQVLVPGGNESSSKWRGEK